MKMPARVALGFLVIILASCATLGGSRQSGYAEVNGARLYYETAGSGDPVVFIHGFTLDSRMWDDQFLVFAERYRVIRYDARGFGKSSVATGPFSIRADLKALLDYLGVKHAHVVGLSMGGRYAADFTLESPQMVKSLTLIDSGISGAALPELFKELAPAVEAGKRGDVAEAKRIWLRHSLFVPANEQPAVARRLAQIVGDYSGWHFVNGLGMHEQPLQPLAITRLTTIRAPTLVIVGSREIPEATALANKIAAEIPGAKKVVIPGAGHMSNMEKPAEVNRALADFLASVR